MSKDSKAAKKAWQTRRKKQLKMSAAAIEAWKTRRLEWRNLRRSILLIECVPEDSVDCSEGKMLEELFRIINFQMGDNKESVKVRTAKANTPKELLKILRGAKESCIHISSHGEWDKKRGTYLDLEKGRLYADDISSSSNNGLPIWSERTKKKAIPQLIFMSACSTGLFTDLCERFFQARTRYFVAPLDTTRFNDSALFSTIFYMLVYVERKNPSQAFKKIRKSFPRISGSWQFYDAHQHVFEHYDPNGVGRV